MDTLNTSKQQKALDFQQESSRLDSLLEYLGLNEQNLSTELDLLLTTYADIAVSCGVQEPSQTQIHIVLQNCISTIEQETLQNKHVTKSDQELKQQLSSKIEQLQGTLTENGFYDDSPLSHENIIQQADDLEKLKKECSSLKDELEAYNKLPPNINLAKAEIERLRQRLGEITAQVQQILGQTVDMPFLSET
ncbi:putative HAUS augmin-like complex subunit 1 [Blattamonas nauphoetae]|uniref:HAUS augmin-like complex subunit 1 n=1 Tax=Blattamonas nauphoetae TaxID=2049346 RepID=A0ABQ9YLI6_9EUKA|nr:putative HAUS augmin-like complex subunit 1 [Blattamonas nauphoetae]